MLNFHVRFDGRRNRYRVRFWHPGGGEGADTTVNVPADYMTRYGAPSDRESKAGDKVAFQWALDEKKRRDGLTTKRHRRFGMTVPEIFELFVRRNPNGNSEATILKSTQKMKHLTAFPAIASLPASEIDSGIAADYKQHRLREGAAPRTVLNELALLKQIIMQGFEWQRDTGTEVVSLHKLPKVPQTPKPGLALTVPEVVAMLEVPILRHEQRTRDLLILGIVTMLRRSVLFGMRREWIDMERRWLSIPAEFMKGPHGRKRALEIPLCEWACDILAGYAEESGEFVFGRRVGPDYAFYVMADKTQLKRNGRRVRFSPHDLRRTGRTWLADAGMDAHAIEILMGHSTADESTQRMNRLYDFVSENRLRDTIAQFDRIRPLVMGQTHGTNGGKRLLYSV